MQFDIAIIGGGPAGLALATSLAGTGLAVAVVEQQPGAALEQAGFDGREIALTHHSQALLREMGAWDLIPQESISPLREARVLNGGSAYALRFDTSGRAESELGKLVSNHAIRRALYRTATAAPEVTLLAGTGVAGLRTDVEGAEVTLRDGRALRARLLVAADSRFSTARQALGIGAETRDFGKRMMVCRLRHAAPHQGIATEWFDYGQTIAMLPLNGRESSAVITLPPAEMARLEAMPEAEFGAEIARRYRQRLGAMELVSTRHVYPLVAVYAERFAATRAVLLGDAAVGMHPVTAHGFNFGLSGQAILAREIRAAHAAGRDIGAPDLLRRYAVAHRRATRPLYLATNATALLYTEESAPARLLRNVALRLGNHLRPVQQRIVSHLMESRAA
ncbi:5-demethoxyubiquinol-8 5-hydroxylase UbiM [Pseudoroseomonas cervicalis]|uniref:Ubiquinone biosynthesis hydroxylase, UbiH/UbiF/VisC/COQ6 family n=1 Tax=Pseudoroseomonas cervicalis ATCC 49957 TaxID=525371 RepID=D5RNX5_9PROT|nr:5-demethoxyubiquinol-8 5-hydroxylase UbiM [Pseudoroseomonas cervicalis]EFH10994.1 ubiquinone biosynthesis hydroxylase, UbiH/UbiF/VisC/COQ6 family [Pseudoroseomonas cervicalis ATCC 49957]